ncbi:hypothetical protein AGMMS49928_20830 [Spirochaetia bacterium]|nr:hypothetical protein AGMMS49928_20830 [Spirochaetia bacterium]
MKKTFKTNGRLLSQVFSSYNTTFDALCELINNSIQAGANEIKIEIDLVSEDDPGPYSCTEYRIIDNGNGVSASEFEQKILVIATDVKQEGKGIGRFAAFQIGSTVSIETTAFDKQEKKYTNTKMTLNTSSLSVQDLSDYKVDITTTIIEKKKVASYYKVSIRDFWNEVDTKNNPKKTFIGKLLPEKLNEALFLKYSTSVITDKIIFFINNIKLEKDSFLVEKPESATFEFEFSDNTISKIDLEYIHYKGKNKNIILSYRVDNNGIKLSGFEDLIGLDYPDDNAWLVHIDSDKFTQKSDILRNLPLDGMDDDLAKLKNEVRITVRNFIKEKHKEYFAFRDNLLQDDYYPYKGSSSPSSREITFNHLAYFIEKDYSILQKKDKLRQIIYPLLDRAMSSGDIEGILQVIISLNDEQAAKFKELLERAELSDVIRFASDIANKQRLLNFLNEIIYGDISKHILERKQLHKIIERHLWLFGEEYTTTPILFSDTSLRNNLNALRDKYFKYEKSKKEGNFTDVSDKQILDITDLFFYNDKPLSNGKHEIMIVELKAPKVKISQKELEQVDRYRYDIETLDKFSKHQNSYKIILVSSGITDFGNSKIGTVDTLKPALYSKSKDYDIEVYVMKWSDIIAKNHQHLSYLGKYLETKDVDVKNIFETEYPELDIKTLVTHTKKANN